MTSSIEEWLNNLGFGEYANALIDNAVDWDLLPHLTNEDLKDLGVAKLGDRKRLLIAISNLQKETGDAEKDHHLPKHIKGSQNVAERRQLTIMFVDLVGSTAMSGRLDPEELREALALYQNIVAGVVKQFDGHIARYMGDGVLCYFGWPLAHEDDAERSVRSGCAIIKQLNAAVAPQGETLEARVGIATGIVVVGDLIGEGAAQEEAVVGETPNLAARLQTEAKPGQIAVSEATRSLLGDLFELDEIGNLDLRGIDGAVTAFLVRGERIFETRFDAQQHETFSNMVGRDQELALLLDRWSQAGAGQGQLVLLTGEAGIGKSRIVHGFLETLLAENHTRIRYQCSPYHADSMLFPVIQQLTLAIGFEADDTEETKLNKLESVLSKADVNMATASPLLASLLGLGEIAEARHGNLDISPALRRQRTLEALFDQLSGLAANSPVLFIIEDAHWIDPTTLELLELCLDRINDMQVVVLVTARPTFEYGFGGHPNVTRLALNRLGRDQVREIVVRITKGKSFPEELLSEIAMKTDGVPLFVEELTKTILESKELQETATAWVLNAPLKSIAIPTSLHDSLMARLDRQQPIKEVAQTAACIGREFSDEVLAGVSLLPASELHAALQQLIDAELLFRRGRPPEATYTFKHALVRDAAYESLLKSKRKAVHTRIVDTLERVKSGNNSIDAALLAYHCTEAEISTKAVEYWQQAGKQAIERSANLEAISHLRSGIDNLKALTPDIDRHRWELSLHTMLAGPLIATKGYGAEETAHIFDRAQELSEKVNDPSLTFPVMYQQWVFSLIRSKFDKSRELADQLAQRSENQTFSGPKIIGHRVRAVNSFYEGNFAAADSEFGAALKLYEDERDGDLTYRFGQDPKAACLSFMAVEQLLRGFPDKALITRDEAFKRAKATKHTNTIAYTIYFACVRVAHCLRDVQGVRFWTEKLKVLAMEQGLAMWHAYSMTHMGWVCSQEKSTNDGIDLGRLGLQRLEETGTRLDQPIAMALLAETLADYGQYNDAVEKLTQALAVARNTGDHWYEAEILRLKADFVLATQEAASSEEAAILYREAIEIASRQQSLFWQLRATNSLAGLLAERGDRREANALVSGIYGAFTEGFETIDLKSAKSLLNDLG